MQGPDVVIYSKIKAHLDFAEDDYLKNSFDGKMDKFIKIRLASKCYLKAFNYQNNILAAEMTGMRPFDKHVILKHPCIRDEDALREVVTKQIGKQRLAMLKQVPEISVELGELTLPSQNSQLLFPDGVLEKRTQEYISNLSSKKPRIGLIRSDYDADETNIDKDKVVRKRLEMESKLETRRERAVKELAKLQRKHDSFHISSIKNMKDTKLPFLESKREALLEKVERDMAPAELEYDKNAKHGINVQNLKLSKDIAGHRQQINHYGGMLSMLRKCHDSSTTVLA